VPTEDGFNTTSGGTKFYRSTASGFGGLNTLTLSFANPIFAFGAYFTGVETFYGTTSITFNDGAPQTYFLADTGNNTQGGPAGTQFFGFRDTVGINSITFTTTNNPTFRDLFAMDDILILETMCRNLAQSDSQASVWQRCCIFDVSIADLVAPSSNRHSRNRSLATRKIDG
jgi:hypothetical protein